MRLSSSLLVLLIHSLQLCTIHSFSITVRNGVGSAEFATRLSAKKSRSPRKENTSSSEEKEEEVVPDNQENLQKTISGGPSTIYSMARRMLVWDDQDYQMRKVLNDSSEYNEEMIANITKTSKVLPKWHPHEGIADSNPNFRTSPPIMNNKGYAKAIFRNARKNNQPSLWRHSLRTYNKMRDVEIEQARATSPSKLKIRRQSIHFHGALVACSKLGLWREAVTIYEEMKHIQLYQKQQSEANTDVAATNDKVSDDDLQNLIVQLPRKPIDVNAYIVQCLIKACIIGMKYRVHHQKKSEGNDASSHSSKPNEYYYTIEEQREPLDIAASILQSLEEVHDLIPNNMHVNALAAAYQYLNLNEDASALLDKYLVDDNQEEKSAVNSAANYLTNGETLDLSEYQPSKPRKDEASYNILIQNSVARGDWGSAIDNLKMMTESGHYPKSKSLNIWSETAAKRERRSSKSTWVKQREEILMYDGSINLKGNVKDSN
ncbi:hypothetical protein CTEN210_17535 [Chaetoceros tenuissimus]|uniref:Uncharacterized protein n=1 Tax=Chaetoceros tenuissimus TaxID=426638 RepID=A0AAD3DAW8_9STRA|nr:hypothetical protein CTEN210_17535 [Chaetoceros tenuissimus]